MNNHSLWLQRTRFFAALLIIPLYAARAGYRNVDQDNQSIQSRSVQQDVSVDKARPLPPKPPGGWGEVDIIQGGTLKHLSNRHGMIDVPDLDPYEEIQVMLRKPEIPKGRSVMVYTVHGGRINGKCSDLLVVGNDGQIEFTFKVEGKAGNYPVVFRYAGREEAMEFWVPDSRVAAIETKP